MTDLIELIHTTPHAAELGIALSEYSENEITLKVPYKPELIGDPGSGILHGGVVTSLIDTASGAAAFLAIKQKEMIATLDLRIDYLKPAAPNTTVFATAWCYQVTSQVLFVRCRAFQEAQGNCIAESMSTFIRNGLLPKNRKWEQ